MDSLKEAAIKYAAKGWGVHPLKPKSKYPNSPNGFHDCTTDPEVAQKWWNENPDDNIGVATNGECYVLDIDGPIGSQSLNDLVNQHGPLPETLMAKTGKGIHYFFDDGGELGNTASKLGKGIDTRGTGGFVVVAPSIHPDGGTYEWLNEGTPLAPLPKWIKDTLSITHWVAPRYTPAAYATNMHPYVRRVWEGSQERLGRAISGNRNETLNHEAFLMGGWIASNSIDRSTVENRFYEIALAIGLAPKEARNTIASGIDKGMMSPIYVPETKVYAHDNEFQQRARVSEGTINIQKGSSFGRSGVSFFWNNRIPVGKLTIIGGRSGIGKSFLTLSLAAHVTNGTDLIDVAGHPLDGEVLFCSYEDDIEDSIGPRADSLDVDMNRCHFIEGVSTEHGPRDFGPQDVPRIVDYMKSCPEIKLVIIDPLGSFVGAGTDSNAENQMRSVLQTLTRAGKETGAAIVMVAHRNKQMLENPTNDDLVLSITGSQGISAIARSVLLVERDDNDIRWVKHVKSNYSRLSPQVSYTFDDRGFRWDKIKRSGNDLAYWLQRNLRSGALDVNEIFTRALADGITEAEVGIARDKLDVNILGAEGAYRWELK